MPRSFLIKKSEKAVKRASEDSRLKALASREKIVDTRPVVTEPLITAVAPFTPLVQPLAVRLYNGYIHDMISTMPFYDPMAFHFPRPSPTDFQTTRASPDDLAPMATMREPEIYVTDPDQDAPPSPTRSADCPRSPCDSVKSGSSSTGSRKSHGFQDGVTVAYTYDAFFVSDGRSRRRNPLGIPEQPTQRARYTCSECGKHYATSSNLSRHKQTHRSLDSKQAKKCPHCHKVYVSMPALSMHILTHNLKHSCHVCGKTFSRPWLLQGHLRSHSGEKPYGCAHCGKAFADRSNLRAHMQTHSAFKHFTCKRCDKSFALKSYLNKHYESSCLKDEMQTPEMHQECPPSC